MHVISFRRLREFSAEHADAEAPLKRWFKIADKARWSDFAELKASCPSADRVGHLIVIDIGGNKYRLIVEVFFRDQVVLIRRVLTHREYDTGEWKRQAPAPGREAVPHEDGARRRRSPARVADAGGVARAGESYLELVRECPLRMQPQSRGREYRQAVAVLDRLSDLGPGRTEDQTEYLLALALFVEKYERAHEPDAGGHGRRDARPPDRDPRGEAGRSRGRGGPRPIRRSPRSWPARGG